MDNNPISLPVDKPNPRLLMAINAFWLGFILYTTAYTIASTDTVNWVLCNLIQLIGLSLVIPSAVYLIHFQMENNYLRILFYTYCIWFTGVVLRGINFDYQSIKGMLFDTSFCIFIYFVPFLILFPRTVLFYKKTFDAVLVLAVFYVLYDIMFIRYLLHSSGDNTTSMGIVEHFSQNLSLSCGFLLLTFVYRPKKYNLFALFIVVLTFFFAVIRARRGLIFMSFSMLFFSYYIFQFANKTKVLNIVFSMFVIILVAFAAVKVYEANKKDRFRLITERIGQQTRNEVEQYFYSDLNNKEWIIGKGMNGKYFCPGVNEGVGKISVYRIVIETGYLQVILNSGLFGLAILLLIAIPAIFMGLFSSQNILSKAAAIWIFLFLLYMYPGTITKFSMHYILVWMSIGICYSKDIRDMSEIHLREKFLSL